MQVNPTRSVMTFYFRNKMSVPVVDLNQTPLMPCSERRARRMVESGKATPFWKKRIFCIRLNVEPSARNMQPIAVGIDPGSKKEGFTVKSSAHTFLNIQADAITHVKDSVEERKNARRERRFRNTPCRANKSNKTIKEDGWLPPSTKARWQWKDNIVIFLSKLYPITDIIIEDIKAKTIPGEDQRNKSFSPLEAGKNWAYS